MSTWGPGDRELTIGGVVARSAERWPDLPGVDFGDDRVTFGQLWDRSVSAANALHDLGVRAGDSVALQLPNCADFVYAWFGASLIGALTVPLNVHLKGDVLHHPLAVSAAKVVVVGDTHRDRIEAVADRLPQLTHVLVPGAPADLPTAVGGSGVHLAAFADLLAARAGEPLAVKDGPRWSDPNLVLFTSGTTGPSKGVVASHHYILTASLQSFAQKGGRQEDVFWTPLPLSHGNAMMQTLLGPIAHGARASLDERFSVSQFWARVRGVGATQVSILGSMITMIWNLPRRDDDADNQVRVLFGAPMPADIQHAFEERFAVRYVTAYGMSEATPMVVSTLDEPPPPGCAGRACARFDVRVFDEEDREVPDGTVGEIVCRPLEPHVMFEGYLDDPAATQTVLRNLWLHTGDYGTRQPDGWFRFVDRKKDYVRRRGENVSSWEVEQALMSHPEVQEAAAFGVPSEVSEDDVMVSVVVHQGERTAPHELLEHCARNLPYYAVPRYVDIVDELPKNDLGKVLKTDLRARGVGAGTWDAQAAGFEVER